MSDLKNRFPCRICKELGHWAAECPQAEGKEGHSRYAAAYEFLARAQEITLLTPQWILTCCAQFVRLGMHIFARSSKAGVSLFCRHSVERCVIPI